MDVNKKMKEMSHDEVEGLHELRRKRHKKKRKREKSLETMWNHLNYSKEDSEIDGDIDVIKSVERAEDQISDEESIKHKDKKAKVDSCMISNNAADRKTKKKEKNPKSFLDISEETSLKKSKNELERRDKEKGHRVEQCTCKHVSFDQGTEDVHQQKICLEHVEGQASSNGEEGIKHKHKKARVDLSMVSNNVETRKKKKKAKNQKSSVDISEEKTFKRTKHESKMREQRDKKKGHEMDQCKDVSLDQLQRAENLHNGLDVSIKQDHTNAFNNSSLLPSTEKEIRHKAKKKKKEKKRKKEKERERDKAFRSSSEILESTEKHNNGVKEAIRRANEIHKTWTLSKERLETLKEKGIKVKSGKWSLQELNLLQSNMDKFLENHGLQDPDDILFHSSVENEDCKNWKRFASQNDFYQILGEGIQRPLDAIVKCAKRIYDMTNYVGKYTEKEVDELRRLQAIHGTDWVTIGQLMGRSRMSVCRKFSTLLATTDIAKKGIWTEDELKSLKEAVHLVTNTASDQEVPFQGISWQAVARMVNTRSKEQCRRKWLDSLCWTENDDEKWWTNEDDFALISRLYNSGITEECDVDWMEVKTEFEKNYSPQWLRYKWSRIKKRVPDFQQKTFEVIVEYLYQKYAKIFEVE